MARGTAEERALSLSPDAVAHLKIEIQDADGTWRDYSHRTAGGRVSAHRDSPVMSATVRLHKGLGEDSLSPLVEQSLQNRNAAGGYAPAADLSRLIRFSAATVPAGVPAVDAPGGDYRPIFEGRIDRVTQDDGDFLDLACSGKAIFIAQKQIREPATYAAPGGTLREVVAQQLLDANPNGKWAPAIVVAAATGSYLTPVEIPMGLTLDAARQLFLDIGWDLRERFDANDALQLMASHVDRNRVDVDAVIEAHEKYRLSRLDLDVEPIRTALRLWYRNAEGVLAFVEYASAAAIADHGDRWAQIPEQLGIDTAPEAQTLVDTIGHDLSGPGAEFAAPIPFAWWVEVYDRLTFRGEPLDAAHHDTDQTIALAGYEHVWDEQGTLVTEVTGTVRIVGAYEAWRRRILPQEAPTNAPVIEPRVMVDAQKLTADGYAKLTSPAGEQVTLQVKLAETAGAAVWRLCAGAADPTPRYVPSGTEVGPADWFTDGTSQQAVLAGVVLVREQIVRRYLQAVGRDSGLTSDWLPVPFDQRGTPWLESTDLTFDEATDQLRMTVVAGAGCQSVRFELADNDAFASPALNTVVPLNDSASAVQLLALAAAARGKIWYARATPYNGVNATGLAGGAQRASVQVSASESGGIAPPRISAYEIGSAGVSVDILVEGSVGAGGAAPLEWQTKVWSDYAAAGEPGWPAAWQASALPQTVSVTRHPRAMKHLRARVRDAGGRITESDVVDIADARTAIDDTGAIVRGQVFSDGGYALASSTATGKRAMADVEDSRMALLSGMHRTAVDTADSILNGASRRIPNASTVDTAGRVVQVHTKDGGAGSASHGQRQYNSAPAEYPVGVTSEFKQRSSIGAPGTSFYGELVTDKPYSDNSGGHTTQTFRGADGQWKREGPNAGVLADWGPWRAIVEVGTQRLDRLSGHATSTMEDARAALLSGMHRTAVDTLDSVLEGSTYRRTTLNEKTGAARGYVGLNANAELALDLPSNIRQHDGVTSRVLAKGHIAGTARHGSIVTFPSNFQNVPMVLIRGGVNHEPRAKWGASGSGSETGAVNTALPQYEDVAPLNLAATGFEMRARLRQKSGSTARAHWFAANSLTSAGTSVARNLDNAPANNDTYTTHFSVAVTANAAVSGFKNDVSVVVAIDVYDGTQWTERATRTYGASGRVSAQSNTYPWEQVPVVVSGLDATDDLRIRIKSWDPGPDGGSFTVHGFDGVGEPAGATGGVTYATSADIYASKTPDADDVVYWEALEVS